MVVLECGGYIGGCEGSSCMVKYATGMSGSKYYVVCREGWKGIRMVDNKLMYGSGSLAWYQQECDDLESRHNGMGRCLWDVDTVRNDLIGGETGWSIFEEREAKVKVEWMLRVVFEDILMSEIGRACLIETGCKQRWWGRCRHICTKFGLIELVNRILLRNVSVNGMLGLGMKTDRKVWKKYICEKIQEVGRQSWKNRLYDTDREKEYVEMKRCPMNESFAVGSVGARVILMVRG